MADPCIQAPLKYTDGKLGLAYNPEKLTVNESGELAQHKRIHSYADYKVGFGPQVEVGDPSQYALPFLDSNESFVLQQGRFGPFRNRDPNHAMYMRVDFRGELNIRQVIEWYIVGGVNDFFVTGSNTILMECRIELPELTGSAAGWKTLSRATASTLEPEKSVQWWCATSPAEYLTGRQDEFTFNWRLRYIHSSGGFPVGATFMNVEAQLGGLGEDEVPADGRFIINGFPIDSWASG